MERLKARNESVSNRIDELKQKFESSSVLSDADRVKELFERKKSIIGRMEDSVEAVKASTIEMNLVNDALMFLNGTL